jgi:signal transduction histidine kinase
MSNESGRLCGEGLSFFSTTNRYISHGLKNILAIISETSGLLDELVELKEQGSVLPAGKLRSLTESIVEEVDRANRLVRDLNSFAHSVDNIVQDVDVAKVLEYMVRLARLDARTKVTTLSIVTADPYTAATSQFFLANLLGRAIEFSLDAAGPGSVVELALHSEAQGCRIVFSGLATKRVSEFPSDGVSAIASALSAEVTVDGSAGELCLSLPKSIGRGPLDELTLGE